MLFSSGPKSSSTDATEGSLVGIWRLGKRLHAGTWTEVFLAQPADAVGNPRCDYVLKRARHPLRENPEGGWQIRSEIEAAAEVSHPNLIPILDSSLTAQQPYCVMPRIEGDTLEYVMSRQQTHPLPVLLWWLRQASQAIAALHAAGWLHRDVKPANMMVSDRGHLTLIDLGFATQHRTLGDPIFRGTPQYSAPETLDGKGTLHLGSDIYSLGMTMQNLLAHQPSVPEEINELIAATTFAKPGQRPSAETVVGSLLQQEIATLGRHIVPAARAA